jgi:hypothetical protein
MRIEVTGDRIILHTPPRWESNRVEQLVMAQVRANSLHCLTWQDVLPPDGSEPTPNLVVLRKLPAPPCQTLGP